MSIATLEAPVRIVARQNLGSAPVAPLKTQCSTCHLRDLCLPCGMAGSDVDRLVFTRRKVKLGQTLYRAGDRFDFIYAVRSGTFKSSLMLADGREQVSGDGLQPVVPRLPHLVPAATPQPVDESQGAPLAQQEPQPPVPRLDHP